MSLRDHLQVIYDKNRILTPALVVDTARPEDHPLHSHFEWDDEVAGEAWRREQARDMIQSQFVVYRSATKRRGEGRVRAWHATRSEGGQSGYRPIEEIAEDPFARELLLRDARRDWEQLKARYQHLVEFLEMVREDVA